MTTQRKNSRPATLIAVTVALASSGHPGRGAEETPTIAVTGTGRVSARPDQAEVQIGVLSRAETAQAALAQNNQAMARLYQLLKERGVAEKDIQTSHVQVSPQYSQSPSRLPRPPGTPYPEPAAEFVSRIVAYNVENTVRISSREIEKLGSLLDALVQAGANQIQGIAFRVAHPEPLLDEARRRAMAHAQHKARVLAGEARVEVGAPLKIEERESFGPAMPMAFAPRASLMAAGAPPMQVAPGEQELSITVSVVYELKTRK